MVTAQFNKIKKIKPSKNLESKIRHIDDIEKILRDIDNYFAILESRENLALSKDDLTQLSRIKKSLFSILLNVEFSMREVDGQGASGLSTIGF